MIVLLLLAILPVLALILRSKRSRSHPPLPPGPKPWPFIGNILDMPTVQPWKKYQEWCKEYKSDVIFLDIPTRPTIILGSAKACFDLLDKRSNIYSDRVVLGWNFSLALMPYTPRWRAHRRMFHQEFYQGTVNKYRPAQRQHARALLSWLSKDPQNTRQYIRQFVTSVIFFVTYGRKIDSMDDEYIGLAQGAVVGFSQASIPGAYWIEFLPFLRHIPSWIPGAASKKLIKKHRPLTVSMVDKPYTEAKIAINNGTAPPSLAASLIDRNIRKYGGTNEDPVYDQVIKNVTGVAYAAGADTTTSACSSFLLAMAMFPEVQKRAQAELDRIVGPSRLPDHDDLVHLPYIQATVMEAMRWMAVTPFGVPHAVTSDDFYNGYHIPKGAVIVPVSCCPMAILRNEKDYPSPDEFRPERFLNNKGNIDPSIRDPTTIAFGFGRRICLGRYFSNNTLSIFIASVLHVFNITAGVDTTGKPVELSTEMEGGLVAMPCNIPCGLEPRSEAATQLIREEETKEV
ncbi:cytochrome P450 [Cristinia sonorae]|uniref:Cytochrome P450 n=1 Tax=Cristinia sonorae TaxID=1940300 RepID=A0A8K0UVP1_9AGAR|nr:cytochrome P450 [Cristinia sonorae]